MLKKNLFYVVIGIFLCIVLEYFIYNLNHKYQFFDPFFVTARGRSIETREWNGVLTNPLLECQGVESDESADQLNISRFELNSFVDEIISSGKVKSLSVYVRDLNNGPWIGINERESFLGGSLLKVPVLISYLKSAEKDPGIMDKVVEFKEKFVSETQYFPPSKSIEIGKKYTVRELIDYMIIYSDNEATYLLFQDINVDQFNEAFEALGFGKPSPDSTFMVNNKTYAGFFRVLFNASYLNRESSEKALEILSKVEFDSGITKLLPRDLVVAHKFGIRTDNGINQLHDCGIVYYPKHQYLVCIMSKGGTFPDMADIISKTSKFIYDQVSKNQ